MSWLMASPFLYATVPTAALTFDTNLDLISPTTSQSDKVAEAEELIKKVIATEEFREAILNHTYNGKKTFVDNDGYSNAEIYQIILDGAEELNKSKNNRMDMGVEFYYSNNSTVGYTYPSITKIYVNTKFFNSYVPAEVTRNLIHEWLHKVGFGHAVSYSTSRDYSVPYGVGSIMEKLAKKVAAGTIGGGSSDPGLITAPSGVSVSTSGSSITIKWNAGTASAGVASYKVYRRLSGSTTNYLQGTTSNLNYSQTIPKSSAVYYVRTVDKNGNTAKSSEVTFTPEVSIFTAPKNLSVSKTSTKITLKWSAATSSVGIKQYKIYRRLSGSSTNYLQGTTTGTSFTQTRATRSGVYYVRAVNNNNETMKSVELSFTK